MTQSYYSINNPLSKGSGRHRKPAGFWSITPYYAVWWVAAMLVFLWFDIEWCMATDFMPLTDSKSAYICLLTIPTLLSLGAILSRRWWVEATILLVFTVFLEANLMYCRTYIRQIPLECYAMAGNLSGFGGSVLASLRWGDLVFVAILIVSSMLGARLGGKRSQRQRWGIFLILGAICSGWWALVLWKHPMKMRIDSTLEYTTGYSIITPMYSPFTLLYYEAMEDQTLTPEAATEAMEWLRRQDEFTARYAASLAEDSTKVYPLRTLLVMVESLESWPIGLSLGGTEVTPNLNRLIADSSTYYNPNVRTQVRGGRSIDGQLLYLAGMHPLMAGVYSFKCIHRPYMTLATESARRGVTSYLFSADQPGTWNGKNIDKAFGIDSIYMNDRLGLKNADLIMDFFKVPYDDDLVESFLNLTADNPDWNGDGRAMGVMVTLSSHGPFRAYRPEYEFPVKPEGCSEYLNDYLSVVHYVDHCLDELVDSLRARPGGEHTMIAITGDHEAFESRRKELKAELNSIDGGEHTPLIIINSPYAGRDSTEIGQVDVYAALLDAAGFYGEASWRGMGLSPWDNRRGDADEAHRKKALKVSDTLLRHPEVWDKYIEESK